MHTRPASRIKVGSVITDMHGRKWRVIGQQETRKTLPPYAIHLPRIDLTVALIGHNTIDVWQVAPSDLLPIP